MNKFTIRPIIHKEESLTSYLLRLCSLNSIDIRDLLRDLFSNYKTIDTRNAHRIDINPLQTIDITLLPKKANINNNYLLENTFYGIINKFLSESEIIKLNSKSTLVKELFTIKKRKFCPLCLQGKIIYKLVWQVNDINHCTVHNIPLSSSCIKCEQEQPYLHMNLAQGLCKFCNNSLTTYKENYSVSFSLTYSNWLSNQWEYLISTDIHLLKNDKEIAKKLFFIAGNEENYFNINNLNHINKDYLYKLVGIISSKTNEKYGIGINILLKLLWKLNYSVSEFSELIIPKHFRDSIDDYLYKNSTIKCIAPWCDYKNSNDKLYKITSIRSKTHNNLHLCLGCCIRYGVNKESGQWEEYGDLINIGYGIILPLINSEKSKSEISKLTAQSGYKIYKIISYLARFKLIKPEYLEAHTPKNHTSITISEFLKYADPNETKMRSLVKNNLNIGLKDFYYFYYDRTVQRYLYNV